MEQSKNHNRINYQVVMEQILAQAQQKTANGRPFRVLLHSCCGPCSTYCIQTLAEHMEVTVFYYNPNIYPPEEYEMRVKEQERFIREFPTKHPVNFVSADYDTERFYELTRGMEAVPEGGERCFICYEMRLRRSYEYAAAHKFDYVTTTLSISPLKNAAKLNEIGARLENEYQIPYLYSDFKKKNGYKRSTEISEAYQMYRQYYCGCVFSKRERDAQIAQKKAENEAQ